MEKLKVTFLPEKKCVEVEKDVTVLSAAVSAGLYLNSACGGDGVCGKCRVILKKGELCAPASSLLTDGERRKGVYLACAARVRSDCLIEIPAGSRLSFEPVQQKKQGDRAEEMRLCGDQRPGAQLAPLCRKLELRLSPPDSQDTLSDADRLARQLRKAGPMVLPASLSFVRGLPALSRDSDWRVTATLARKSGGWELVALEPGVPGRNLGLAFDIGTTTVSGQLVDLGSGAVLVTKAAYNRQAAFGPDVITRIIHAQKKDGMEALHRSVTETMNMIIAALREEQGCDLNDITCCVCAGNTTMMHLLLQVDPQNIRRDPYIPAFSSLPPVRAQDAGISISPRGLVYIVPGVSSYVGGDTTAGIVSCGIDTARELSLLIDIGTNGEIVLGNSEFLMATSASAGPAFEGSGQSCGMRSSPGAIQKVRISSSLDVTVETIGPAQAKGICGSGYVDALAEMLTLGIIDRNGKIRPEGHARIRAGAMGKEFVLVFAKDSGTGSDIVITEPDIDNIKRAKAAIYSAVAILVKRMSFSVGDIKRIFVAGGFGTSLDINSAKAIGLLPGEKGPEFSFVGNSSLAGARQMLLSEEVAQKADGVAARTTNLELSGDNEYMEEYTAALFFPHTDLTRFKV
jgi:uncharacterized 2Fe-2S/4Fe-4S cluster protein (DUF4445 family)